MKNLDAIYFAVRKLAPADRPAYLTRACAGDDELQKRVEQMLAVSAEAEAFITDLPDDESEDRTSDNGSAKNLKLDLADAPDEAVGQMIGRYKILERVGEGGCGVVYVAEQTEPVRRRVALKVIKLGMDTKQVVARFEAERQALAMMDHPNIARVLDAATNQVRSTPPSLFTADEARWPCRHDALDEFFETTEPRISDLGFRWLARAVGKQGTQVLNQ